MINVMCIIITLVYVSQMHVCWISLYLKQRETKFN